jgi:plastocyanin
LPHLSRRILAAVLTSGALAAAGCEQPADTRLQPDVVLQAELGLTVADRVHSIRIAGGEVERAEPRLLSIEPGAYVEFVTEDWLIHEVIFETDSLTSEQRAFLERTDQVASPPLIELDSRYVLAFEGAPPGRYVYRLEGNGRAGQGAIVVMVAGPG